MTILAPGQRVRQHLEKPGHYREGFYRTLTAAGDTGHTVWRALVAWDQPGRWSASHATESVESVDPTTLRPCGTGRQWIAITEELKEL